MEQRLPDLECAEGVTALHGTLVEVSGVGVLLTGVSGSGKSDLAFGLVDRGHRLVADDLVEFRVANGQLIGSCRPGCAGFIGIHGLGVVNLARIYGEQLLCQAVPLGLVLRLETADERQAAPNDRLYGQQRDWMLLGVSVRELLLPCGRGRDLPLLVELAVRLSCGWLQGCDDVADFEVALSVLKEGRR